MASLSSAALALGAFSFLLSLEPIGASGTRNVQAPASDSATADEVNDLLESLRTAEDAAFMPALEAAYAAFRVRALALDFEPAIRIGEGMHDEVLRRGERYVLTSGWSATQLGLVYTRAAQHPAAERVLSERVEVFERRLSERRGQSEPADNAGLIRGLNDLLDRRGMARLAGGNEAGGIADLGGALVRGSSNARLILGRRALRLAGSAESEERASRSNLEARRLFSTLLEEEPRVAAWALRGWGLTLLPPSRP